DAVLQAGDGLGGGRRGYVGFFVEELEDAFARGHGGLEDVELFAQVFDGLVELLAVLDKQHDGAHGDGAAEGCHSAVPDDGGEGERGDEFCHGQEDGVGKYSDEVGVAVFAVHLLEGEEVERLAVISLHGAYAA